MFLTRRDRSGRDVVRQIMKRREKGKGLVFQNWHFPESKAEDIQDLVDGMLAWCKTTLAGCRRPYGIDLFDLIIAFRTEEDNRASSLTLPALKPLDLYQDELPERLSRRISEALHRSRSSFHVSAGVFSWGEAAHEALGQA